MNQRQYPSDYRPALTDEVVRLATIRMSSSETLNSRRLGRSSIRPIRPISKVSIIPAVSLVCFPLRVLGVGLGLIEIGTGRRKALLVSQTWHDRSKKDGYS